MSDMPDRPRCPFYGFVWPASGSNLFRSQGGECGLDLNRHQPCRMEFERRAVDYGCCEIGLNLSHMIEAGRHLIRFHAPDFPEGGLALDAWRDRVMWRR